jgi:putative ABC transport system substrate-binding protein
MLAELNPGTKRIAFLGLTNNQSIGTNIRVMQEAAKPMGIAVRLLKAGSPGAIERAFEVMAAEKFDGFIVAAAAQLLANQQLIIDLAARRRLLAIYSREEYVASGGLLSLGVDREHQYRRAAEYVDRILRGAKPADLPVEQPTKFERVVNLRTARALGLRIPQSILLRADRVIE